MRRKFAIELYRLMREDENIILITADMGYGMLDEIRDNLPNQFYNVGAAEMAMMGIAVGMALEGKTPVVYSITPFLLYRPFEIIRNYIDHECVPIIMAGSGRGHDYSNGGFSHYAGDHDILKRFKNITFVEPEGEFDLRKLVYSNLPTYINLKR